ncbi:hypothetical protein LCGC14_2234540 [marine sediment metagenome]|uniref:Uncharacterized protein n=1 Tax=marine sediment metagenome TaxID=412755 RepID=A0A0F9FJS8_9ZZZZ
MKRLRKLWGNPYSSYVEVNLDLSRWLIGFGWMRRINVPKWNCFTLHVNVGPFAVIFQVGE